VATRQRRSIVENAAGQTVCPACKEHRLTLVWLIYRSAYESVTVHTEAMRVVHQTKGGEREGVAQHVTILWRCRNNHEFATEMDYRPDDNEPGLGNAAYGTVWAEGSDDDDRG
jgi:hypothetical protein